MRGQFVELWQIARVSQVRDDGQRDHSRGHVAFLQKTARQHENRRIVRTRRLL
jgi:hypothetical protein